MNARYFIIDVNVPAGSRTMEHKLADLVRPYIDFVLSKDAMERLRDSLIDTQEQILEENRRLSPVRIELDLPESEGDDSRHWSHFYIGQVYVTFRKVAGELI